MSTKNRTPEDFPTMKVRGQRRRRLAPWQRATGAFKRLGVSAQSAAAAASALFTAVRS